METQPGARFPITLEPEGEEAGTVIRARVAVRNALIYTPVTLTKTDITGANTVPGALIEVRDESGAVIYRAYTDERGELPDIPVTPGGIPSGKCWLRKATP